MTHQNNQTLQQLQQSLLFCLALAFEPSRALSRSSSPQQLTPACSNKSANDPVAASTEAAAAAAAAPAGPPAPAARLEHAGGQDGVCPGMMARVAGPDEGRGGEGRGTASTFPGFLAEPAESSSHYQCIAALSWFCLPVRQRHSLPARRARLSPAVWTLPLRRGQGRVRSRWLQT